MVVVVVVVVVVVGQHWERNCELVQAAERPSSQPLPKEMRRRRCPVFAEIK